MPRYIRNTAVLAKTETTYGTDAVPTGAANAVLVSNVTINPLNANNVDRELVRAYFGASEQLVGVAYVELTMDVELAGSGAAGTAPAWGPLLKACAFAETVTAGQRVEYLPKTDTVDSVSMYYYDAGVVHKLLGARGDVTIKAGIGERPMLSFRFLGLDGGISADAVPGVTLTAWKTPSVITDQNTGDITLGGTYATGAVTGGTAYPSRGIEISAGNAVAHTPLLGGETIDLSGRAVTASMQLEVTAAQEVTLMGEIKANTLRTLSLLHGTAAGYKVLLHGAAVQFVNPTKQEINGRRLMGLDCRFVPVSGNDELRIVVL